MTSARVREALKRQPFIPFTVAVAVADQKEYTIDHPEFAALSPGGRELTVYETDDVRHTIDLLLVTQITDRVPTVS
jgi:hypothetical protein